MNRSFDIWCASNSSLSSPKLLNRAWPAEDLTLLGETEPEVVDTEFAGTVLIRSNARNGALAPSANEYPSQADLGGTPWSIDSGPPYFSSP